MSQVKIDCAQIPRIEVNNLCRTLLAAIERFYDDPANQKRFEDWQRKRREEGKSHEQQNTAEIKA